MEADPRPTHGAGSVGDPPTSAGYPQEAVQWLVGTRPGRVLELGAGTGELTTVLLGLGHDVVATDPSQQLVDHLKDRVPRARLAVARAEDLPLPASSVDIVVAASTFGEFDAARALPEIARVLGPGGVFAVITSSGDRKVPWVRKMLALADISSTSSPESHFESSDIFTLTDRRSFRQWEQFYRPTLVAFVAASTKAAALAPAERDDLVAEAVALYDGYGRGPDGLLMPWIVDCYRARVKGTAGPVPAAATDDGLLIDFF